jgi:general secretion pathway protein H
MEPLARARRKLRCAAAAGFTLIEMMVVVLILGVLAAVVGLAAAPGDAAMAESEARRLCALLELAMAEPRASGQSIAWSAEHNAYSFWHRDEAGDWRRFPSDSVYRQRLLPLPAALATVRLDGREAAPGESITFAPYGLRAAIRATLSTHTVQFSIEGDVLGRVTLQRLHPY